MYPDIMRKFLEQGKEVTALDIADGMLKITKSRVRQNYPDKFIN